MSDFFGNIDAPKTKIPLQKHEGGVVRNKKAGRPRRPNMERYIIKMDKALHAHLVHYANEHGLNKSAVISQAVRAFIVPYKSLVPDIPLNA